MSSAHPEAADGERARIAGSRAFRRLSGKTQVIHAPQNDHVATRLTHTLEVAGVARDLSRALDPDHAFLDHAIVECIALAHDVGHPPFGHAGEAVLARLSADAGLGGFHHASFGVRLLSVLERDPTGRPVVQSPAILEGIVAHSKGKTGAVFVSSASRDPSSAGPRGTSGEVVGLRRRSTEALLVRAADLYAYASGDLDDAYRLGVFSPLELPIESRRVLGDDGASVRRVLIERTARATLAEPECGIHLDEEADHALSRLRAFLYERFYEGPITREQTTFSERVLTAAWKKLLANLDGALAKLGWQRHDGAPVTPRDALDALACMTDRFAIAFAG